MGASVSRTEGLSLFAAIASAVGNMIGAGFAVLFAGLIFYVLEDTLEGEKAVAEIQAVLSFHNGVISMDVPVHNGVISMDVPVHHGEIDPSFLRYLFLEVIRDLRKKGFQWTGRELNPRPLPCQGSDLPLIYQPVPTIIDRATIKELFIPFTEGASQTEDPVRMWVSFVYLRFSPSPSFW
jgi:hypothetical protein